MLGGLVAILLVATSCQADQGVLVGTSDSAGLDGGGQQRFTTYWARVGSGGTLLETLPDLLVPTNGGVFQRLSIQRRCNRSREGDWSECGDSLVVAVLGRSAGRRPRPRPNTEAEVPCYFEKLVVQYAGPGLISLERWNGNSSTCEVRGGRTSVEPFVRSVSSTRELAIDAVVGHLG